MWPGLTVAGCWTSILPCAALHWPPIGGHRLLARTELAGGLLAPCNGGQQANISDSPQMATIVSVAEVRCLKTFMKTTSTEFVDLLDITDGFRFSYHDSDSKSSIASHIP